MRACNAPARITSGSEENIFMRRGADMKSSAAIISEITIDESIPHFETFRALSCFPAPRFCPTLVVKARESVVIGRRMNPSILP